MKNLRVLKTSPTVLEVTVGTQTIAVAVRRSERAKRMRLQVANGIATIIVPRWATVRQAQTAAQDHALWLHKHLTKAQEKKLQNEGMPGIWLEGQFLHLEVTNEPDQSVEQTNSSLIVRSPNPGICLESWLRKRAAQQIQTVLEHRSAEMGMAPKRVSLRDQKTKWGACTSRSTITFNWRLVMAPPEVLDYVVVHELAHLREMNHSPRFWSIVAQFCPNHKEHRRWLKVYGERLRLPDLSSTTHA